MVWGLEEAGFLGRMKDKTLEDGRSGNRGRNLGQSLGTLCFQVGIRGIWVWRLEVGSNSGRKQQTIETVTDVY